MNIFWSAILGIIQGLTEFLPVSSSGHLVIIQNLIPNFSQLGILFDVVLHTGTLLAVLIYFRKKIFKLSYKYLKAIFIGSIPALLIGFLLNDYIFILFENIKLVGLALIITSLINYLTDSIKTKKSQKSGLLTKISFRIGISQALAIIPGISRSGATIFSGTLFGLSRKKAAEFSFLLSIPAVFGANFLQFIKYSDFSNFRGENYAVGFIASFLSGILAIKIVFKFLLKKKFMIFAVYCFLLGIILLFLF